MAGQGLLLSTMLFPVARCRKEFCLYDLRIANCKGALGGNLRPYRKKRTRPYRKTRDTAVEEKTALQLYTFYKTIPELTLMLYIFVRLDAESIYRSIYH